MPGTSTVTLDAGEANDNGSLFRFSDGPGSDNLSTRELGVGSCTPIMEMRMDGAGARGSS